MTDFQTLPTDHPMVRGTRGPEAMAIGDSIFNGVRSATINRALARSAPPAQLARAKGWPMRLPDYPRPVLLDLEREIREGIDFDRIQTHILQNAASWMEQRGTWSAQPVFDNIAISGATYADLHELTAGDAREKAERFYERLKRSKELDFELVAELLFNLNAAFLLNPSGHPDLDDLTPLEQVATRGPKRLFINIGSNEGLFRIGISGNFSRKNRAKIGEIPGLARTLAQKIRAQCPELEQVYFNLLIRPRTIANLAPRDDEDMFANPGDDYFERYVGRLGSMNGMTGAQMRTFDEEIASVNEKAKQEMRQELGQNVHFVDIYNKSTQFDGKHYGNDRKVEMSAGGSTYRLSNLPFSSSWLIGFRQGGLFGLDNMHPTAPGYALLGQSMAEAVARAEGGQPARVNVQDAFDADSLLQNPPSNLDGLNLLFSMIGDLGIVRFG